MAASREYAGNGHLLVLLLKENLAVLAVFSEDEIAKKQNNKLAEHASLAPSEARPHEMIAVHRRNSPGDFPVADTSSF